MKAVVESIGKTGSRVHLGEHDPVFDQRPNPSDGEPLILVMEAKVNALNMNEVRRTIDEVEPQEPLVAKAGGA